MIGVIERPGERGDRFVDARLVGVGEHRHGGTGAADQVVDNRLHIGIDRRFYGDCHDFSHLETEYIKRCGSAHSLSPVGRGLG